MAINPSQLNQLVEDSRTGSREARCALLRDLLEVYLAQPNALAPKTREEFGAVLAALYKRADDATQHEIAERIIPSPAAPAALLRVLVNSGPNIAAPVLRAAAGFTDQALIRLIKEIDALYLSAIAQRRQVSEPVAEALVARGEANSLVMLAKNQNAALSPAVMSRIVAAARRRPELQKPLTARYDLPPHLLIRMFFFISAELRRDVFARAAAIEPALVRDAMDAIRDALLTPAEEDSAEVSDARRVVEEKAANGNVDEAFLKTLLQARERASVVYAFAWITGLDARAVKTMFKDASLESLAVASRASSLGRDTFAALAKNMVKAQQGADVRAPIMLDLYEKISPEIAEKLMRFWRLRARAAADTAKIASLLQGVEGLAVERRAAS